MGKINKENRNLIIASIGIFGISLLTLLFFLNGSQSSDLKATVLDHQVKTSQENSTNDSDFKYENLNETMGESFVVLGLDGLVRYASTGFMIDSGYTSEEIQSKLFFSLINPEDLELVIAAFGQVLESEIPANMVGPFRLKTIDESEMLNMASIMPIIENGKITEIVISTKDISEGLEKVNPDFGTSETEESSDENLKDQEPKGPKIRDTEDDENTRLVVDKLAQLLPIPNPDSI